MGDWRQNRGPAVVTTLARQLASDACRNCHRLLTAEELFYYLRRCEGCERAWHDRIDAWRHGGDDPELSAMFGGGPEGHA